MDKVLDTVARTIWAEARSDGIAGMTAVANVISNRVSHPSWWGKTWEGVCRARSQFSCWNGGDENYRAMINVKPGDASFDVAVRIASDAIAGRLADTTKGATTYKVTKLPWPQSWGVVVPPLAVVGHQSFYTLQQKSQPTMKG